MNKDNIDRLMATRLRRYNEIDQNPTFIKFENQLCKEDFFHWAHYWVFTFNPQNTGTEFSAWRPFKFFPKQIELIKFIEKSYVHPEDGLCVKGRQLVYSWCTLAYAIHKWLYFASFVSTFTANL